MLRSRLFEEAVAQLWHDRLISGEMHLGTGEKAIIGGMVAHLDPPGRSGGTGAHGPSAHSSAASPLGLKLKRASGRGISRE